MTDTAQLRTRHGELVDKKFQAGLTEAETAELAQINAALDAAEEEWFEPVKEAIREMTRKAEKDEVICRLCGQPGEGVPFARWVKPTFTNWDKLLPGEIVCNECLFWLNESSQKLAEIVGKAKPQRMRNYSHFVVNGEWVPLSKGGKARMKNILLGSPFPELAVIADSGQKHIVFQATRNPANGQAGWVQFEEQKLWLEPDELRSLLDLIEPALDIFSKSEVESGRYLPYRVMNFGLDEWQEVEAVIKPLRGSLILKLALFLAQKRETDGEQQSARDGGGSAGDNLARDRGRIQEPLPKDDLGTVREHGQGKRVHEQPGQVRQLAMFEDGGNDSGKDDQTS